MLSCKVKIFGCWCPAFAGEQTRSTVTVYVAGECLGNFPVDSVRIDD